MTATTTIDEKMAVTLDFGNNSRYKRGEVFDGGTTGNTPSNTTDDDVNSHGDLEQGMLISNWITLTAGRFKIGTAYQILFPGTTDFTLIGADDNIVGTIFTATGVGEGTGKACDIQSRLTSTSVEGGIDTGLVESKALESSVVRLQTYTGVIVTPAGVPIPSHGKTVDKTEFYVYDMYGRGYSIGVKDSGTISSFDGTTLVVNNASSFDTASKNNKKLIAVQKAGTSDVEFMMYNKKASASLTISNRVLYTGLGHSFANNDTVYVLDTPLQLVLQDLM